MMPQQDATTAPTPAPHRKPRGFWKFVAEHPYFCLFVLAVGVPLLVLAGIWGYLRLTTDRQITEQLHALGLPANGLELETWRQPPDDGRLPFCEALQRMQVLIDRIDSAKSGEFERLTHELKPEEFAQNQPALEALFRDLAPIRTRMREAARHASLTFGLEYRNGFSARCNPVMSFRSYALAVARHAAYDHHQNKNTAAATALLTELLAINRRIHCFLTIEQLVLCASDGIARNAANDLLSSRPTSAPDLRILGAELRSPLLRQQYERNFTHSMVGEMASVQTYFQNFLQEQNTGGLIAWGYNLKPYAKALLLLSRDLDHRSATEYMLKRYQDAGPLFSLRFLRYPHTGFAACCLGAHASHYSDLFLLMTNTQKREPFQSTARTIATMCSSLLQAGIACELAARRLEGKEWPADLSEDCFPRDPLTEHPFSLVRTKDSLLIHSPGPDRKDSGKAALFNRTGCMKDSSEVPAVAAEDDIVFRLPLDLNAPQSAPAANP